jgi:hypothetical protein
MAFRLVAISLRQVLRLLLFGCRSSRSKDLELLVLRQEIGVLRRQVQRPSFRPEERMVLSVLGLLRRVSSLGGRYEDLAELDWDTYRSRFGDISRLDRIPEEENDTPNAYKASKQADVLMLFYLLSSDELAGIFDRLGYEFESDMIRRTIDYYLQRTSHGSTLSRVVHSWVLARSDRERSWKFYEAALRSDLDDLQGGTTAEGIHLGAMAGTVDLL